MKLNGHQIDWIAIVSTGILCTMFGIVSGFAIGKKATPDTGHSLCTKAIELKVDEADSLKLELARVKDDLRHCEDLYQELNNKHQSNHEPRP